MGLFYEADLSVLGAKKMPEMQIDVNQ